MTRTEAAQLLRWVRNRRDAYRIAQARSTSSLAYVHRIQADALDVAARDLHATLHDRYRRFTYPTLKVEPRLVKRKETR